LPSGANIVTITTLTGRTPLALSDERGADAHPARPDAPAAIATATTALRNVFDVFFDSDAVTLMAVMAGVILVNVRPSKKNRARQRA
jgi:hypothetical protein